MKQGRAYWVKWEDSVLGDPGWRRLPVKLDVQTAETVGLLAVKTKRKIVLAQNVGENGEVAGLVAIPRACVLAVKRLPLP